MTPDAPSYDLVLVGGGLANGLIALRLHAARPDLRIALVEAARHVGGNHTWSFHDTDLGTAQRAWMTPLVTYSWPAHEVRFAGYTRRIDHGYNSVTSERLRALLSALPGVAVVAGRRAIALTQGEARLDDGTVLRGAVIDGRGAAPTPHLTLGYQKFLGQEITVAAPHGLAHPIIMDGTVDQIDGYRFVYVLPLDAHRLLIEDTYYADGAEFEPAAIRGRIAAYAAARGWSISGVVREEEGILPIVLNGDIEALWRETPPGSADPAGRGVARAGLRAALFHPTTGYSLPDAVRLADRLAASPDLSGAALARLTRDASIAAWRRHGFSRLLNRLLFLAARPAQRVGVMARFYRLPVPIIARFYAGETTRLDRLRILAGKPPVNVCRALKSLAPGAAERRLGSARA